MGLFGGPRRLPVSELAPASSGEVRPEGAIQAPAGLEALPLADAATLAEPPAVDGAATGDGTRLAQGTDTAEDDLSRIDAQIIGNGFQVNGRLWIGRFARLSDWLNMQQGWIHVENATLIRPGQEATGTKPCSQWVRLEQVILVGEHREKQLARPDGPRIQKDRRRVRVVTAGYTMRGYVHLQQGGSMQTFLESADSTFIPMTDVVVRWLSDETLVSHHAFTLINRGQLISVADETEQAETDASIEDVAIAVQPAAAPAGDVAWLSRSA